MFSLYRDLEMQQVRPIIEINTFLMRGVCGIYHNSDQLHEGIILALGGGPITDTYTQKIPPLIT